MDSPVLDVAIGMVFTFAVLAGLSAVVSELAARLLGLKARFLLLGIRELVDGREVTSVELSRAEKTFQDVRSVAVGGRPTTASATEALLGSSIMRAQGMTGTVDTRDVKIVSASADDARLPKIALPSRGAWLFRNPLRSLPSYVSSRTFSAAVVDLVVPDAKGETTLDTIREQVDALEGFPVLTDQLKSLLKASENSLEAFRTGVEHWYDDHMDRVSGWYKRHIAKWSLAFGAVLVIALNLNSIAIATSLYTNESIRAAVTAVATEATQCDGMRGDQLDACLDRLTSQLETAQDAGLPIGWHRAQRCAVEGACTTFAQRYGLVAPGSGLLSWHLVVVLVGWLLTIVALVPGARFWYDILGKLGSLRTTGPKPVRGT